jgi:hypothetical protein
MMVLVGDYLVSTGWHGRADNGKVQYRGTWMISRSPAGSGRDWQTVEVGQSKDDHNWAYNAGEAALQEACDRARVLLSDASLEAKPWTSPFPTVAAS